MKKASKKAILGFAMSMIFSMGIIQGISQKSVQTQNVTLQQVSLGCGYMSGRSEGGAAGAWGAAAGMAGGFAVTAGGAALVNAWNPAGWVIGVVVGGAAL
jgi:hypothetical protein